MQRIYTDGAANQINKAGFASLLLTNTMKIVIFGPVPTYKISGIKVRNNKVIFKQLDQEYLKPTNNRGEFFGIIFALYLIKKYELDQVTIISDSNYCIKCITEWYPSWVENNDLHSKKNIDLLEIIDRNIKQINNKGKKIIFQHQRSHQSSRGISGQKKLDIDMNNMVDSYAKQGQEESEVKIEIY